jgi:hypothetical protein
VTATGLRCCMWSTAQAHKSFCQPGDECRCLEQVSIKEYIEARKVVLLFVKHHHVHYRTQHNSENIQLRLGRQKASTVFWISYSNLTGIRIFPTIKTILLFITS